MEFLSCITKGSKEIIMLWYCNFSSFFNKFKSSCTCPILVAYLQVMDMLGPSLWDVWNSSGQT